MSNVKTRNQRGCVFWLVIASFVCLALAVAALSLQVLDLLRGSPERTSTTIAFQTEVVVATARADATHLAPATSTPTATLVAVIPTAVPPPAATPVQAQVTLMQAPVTPPPSGMQSATATLTDAPLPTSPPQATSTATATHTPFIPTAINPPVATTAPWRFELEGFELRMTAAEWIAQDGRVYLLVLGRLVNTNDTGQCAYARSMRLLLDGVEYRPNNGLMGRIQPTLGRDYLGAYAGQCVAANSAEATFAAFEIPQVWEQAELVFEGEAQAVILPQEISATATNTPPPATTAAWRFELKGFELRMTAAEWTAREGYFYLVVLGRLVNDTDREQCAYARSMRLLLDGVEYRPNNGLMGRIQPTLGRDYLGAYAGQCVAARTAEATFAVFEIPQAWEQAELVFEGQAQAVTLPVAISATATLPASTSAP